MSPRPKTSPAVPTLATVAEAVGVSRMTVSNAFNRPDQLSPALRERVLAVARELGYAGPDPVARTLSRGTTGSVGLVFDFALSLAFSDTVSVQFLHGVATGCEERGLGLSLVPRLGGGTAAELVRSALVDGYIVYCMAERDERLDAIDARRLPYVVVDQAETADRRRVNIDDRGASRAIAEHLAALGHRRVGLVLPAGYGTPGPSAADAEASAGYHVELMRLRGWREGLEPAGVDWSAVPVATGDGQGTESGRRAAARLLDRADRPTAILCMADHLALGVLQAAAERGIRVPDELSVTGFDDIPEAASSTPPLTTVHQPHGEKGRAAVRLLLDGDGATSVALPTELVIRASTAPAP